MGEGEKCPRCNLTSADIETSPQHIPPGTILRERYLIGRVLGQGGFGITYIGRDLQLDIRVAIKEYYPQSSFGISRNTTDGTYKVTSPFSAEQKKYFEKGKSRFLDEARIMARLAKEPSIVRVQDFFDLNNTAYIVMEYIDGITLGKYAEQRGGKIPPAELFEMIEPLFGLMQTMHEMQLLHRDISPDNIMIENGEVKLLDFGCARDIGAQKSTLTAFRKPGYAPIEQVNTSGSGQGPWSDVYAFAGTIYFCLTGVRPPESSERLMLQDDPLVAPRELGADITEAQEKAILHAMAQRVNQRTKSMREFYGELYDAAPGGTGSLDVVCRIKGTKKQLSAKVNIALSGVKEDGRYGDVSLKDGAAEVIIKGGETVRLRDIPAGAKYKISAAEAEGYTLETMRTEGSVVKNASLIASLEFVRNVTERRSLTVSARAAGGKPPKEISVKITLSGDDFNPDCRVGGYDFENGTCELTLETGETAVISGIPKDTEYSVEAVAEEGFRAMPPKTGRLDVDREAEAELKQDKKHDSSRKTDEPSETPADDGKKRKKSPVAAIVAVLIVLAVAIGGGAAWFMTRSGLPSDAEKLFEFKADAVKDGSRWVILGENSAEFREFLTACGERDSYVWATFNKEPGWASFSFEEYSSVGDGNSVVLTGQLNGDVYNAGGSSVRKAFSDSGFRDFATLLTLRGNFEDSDRVKVRLYVIKTSEEIAVPKDKSESGAGGDAQDKEEPYVALQIFAQDTSTWSMHMLKDYEPLYPGQRSPFEVRTTDHTEIDNMAKISFDGNQGVDGAMKLIIRAGVPDRFFSWPEEDCPTGTFGSKADINLEIRDIVVKATGYSDVVLESAKFSETLWIKKELGWFQGNYLDVDIGYAAIEQLGLTPEEYMQSYIPALMSIRCTAVLNSLEMTEPDFSGYYSYEWPDESAVASGSFRAEGNENHWREYKLADVIGEQFTDWDGDYNLYVICNSHKLFFTYHDEKDDFQQISGTEFIFNLAAMKDETVVMSEDIYDAEYNVFWRIVPRTVKHTLTVNYLDVDGSVIAEKAELSVEDGREYLVNQFELEGYEMDRFEGDALSGKMDSDKTVTFYYRKKTAESNKNTGGTEPLIEGAEVLVDFANLYEIDPANAIFRAYGGYPLYADFAPYDEYLDEIVKAMKEPDAKIVVSHAPGISPMLEISHSGGEYSYKYATTRDGPDGRDITIIDCEHFVRLFTENYDLAIEEMSALWIEDSNESENFRVYDVQLLKTSEGKYENTSSSSSGKAYTVSEAGKKLDADIWVQAFAQDRVTWGWTNINGQDVSQHYRTADYVLNAVNPPHFDENTTDSYRVMPTFGLQIGPCRDEINFRPDPADCELSRESFDLKITAVNTVIKAEGYDDVVIPKMTASELLHPKYRKGSGSSYWLEDAHIVFDLYREVDNRLGVYGEEFVKEYLPNLKSISFTLDVEKLEVLE